METRFRGTWNPIISNPSKVKSFSIPLNKINISIPTTNKSNQGKPNQSNLKQNNNTVQPPLTRNKNIQSVESSKLLQAKMKKESLVGTRTYGTHYINTSHSPFLTFLIDAKLQDAYDYFIDFPNCIHDKDIVCGMTALALASGLSNSSILIEKMIEMNCNPNETCLHNCSPIHSVMATKDTSMLKILLKNGANVDRETKFDSLPLLLAVSYNFTEAIDLLLEYNVDINQINSKGETSIYKAVLHNNLAMLKKLIDCGANINTFVNNCNPLYSACAAKKWIIVKFLLDNGASITIKNDNNFSLLDLLIINKNVEFLFEYCSSDEIDNYYFQSHIPLLQYYCDNNNKKILSILLKYHSNIYSYSNDLKPILFYVLLQGKFDIARILIKYGFYKQIDDFIPIQYAYNINNYNLVDYILQINPNSINDKDKKGNSILYNAVKSNNIDVINHILKHNVNINQLNNGETALYYACSIGNFNIVKLLINNNANIHIPNINNSSTNLSIAMDNNYYTIIEYLLKSQIDSQIYHTNSLESPLMKAVINNSYELTEILLQYNVNVNYKLKNDITSLIIAINQNNYQIVELLIENGANVNDTYLSETILKYTKHHPNKNKDIIKLIKIHSHSKNKYIIWKNTLSKLIL